jgi:hypothetical protein
MFVIGARIDIRPERASQARSRHVAARRHDAVTRRRGRAPAGNASVMRSTAGARWRRDAPARRPACGLHLRSVMSTSIHFDVEQPATYQPAQLLVRILFMIALAVIGAPLGWLFHVLYIGLPILAATAGPAFGQRYAEEVGTPLLRALRWLLALHAYLALLTDRPPLDEQHLGIRYDVVCRGTPTVSSALLRLITSIPAAILLWVAGVVSTVLWLLGAVSVLLWRRVPTWIFDFQRGVLRLFAHFAAHHASLVEGPAPVMFETGPDRVDVSVAGARS